MKTSPIGRLDVLALKSARRVFETRARVPKMWPIIEPLAQIGIAEGMKRLGIPKRNLLKTKLGKAFVDALERTRVSAGGCV